MDQLPQRQKRTNFVSYNNRMTDQKSHGVISHDETIKRKTDYLYRVSLKCLIKNAKGEVLVVKETGRDWWDLPGGGMDHGEDLKSAIAREMREEVNLQGDFTYRIIEVEEPAHLGEHNFWQLRLIFEIHPQNTQFSPGDDGDQIAFMDAQVFKNSQSSVEQRIHEYVNITSAKN